MHLTLPALPRLLAAALLTASPWALALEIQAFSAAALAQAQQAGKPVAVHFHADWCPTCKLQEMSLAQLKAEPGLDLTVLVADYDKWLEARVTAWLPDAWVNLTVGI